MIGHRIYRELDDNVKKKISDSSKGKKKNLTWRQNLSQALIDYWSTIPHKPTSSGETDHDITTYQS